MKRKTLFLPAILAITLSISAFRLIDDILTRMNLEASTAQQFILGNFTGYFDYEINPGLLDETDRFRIPYSKKILPAILSGDKAGAAKELCEYVRMYCNSREFEKAYNKRRLGSLPLRDKGASAASLSGSIEVHQINMNNYKNDKKYVAEEQKLKDEEQARLDKLLEQAKGPFEFKKEWEAAYPVDPAVMIRARLQEYLALVATVDFNAKLSEPDKYNKRKFVNPAFEKKSLRWKAIFRAGKEVNDVVTAFVKEWLKGDIIAKEKISMPSAKTSTPKPASATSSSPTAIKVTTADTTTTPPEKPAAPAKEKKALLNKFKNKVKAIVD